MITKGTRGQAHHTDGELKIQGFKWSATEQADKNIKELQTLERLVKIKVRKTNFNYVRMLYISGSVCELETQRLGKKTIYGGGHYLTALRSTNWEHFKSNPPPKAMKLLIIKSVNVPSVSNRYPFMKNPIINPSP